ncbi:MAG TPA: hypothetical protein VFU02_13490 [Polyangiaceae bacterium]|nr:hypothetical protein [Polyangiaceae bacterium]
MARQRIPLGHWVAPFLLAAPGWIAACGSDDDRSSEPGTGGVGGSQAGAPGVTNTGGSEATTAGGGGSGGAGLGGAGGAPEGGAEAGGMAGAAGAPADAPPGEAGFLELDPYAFRGGPELDGLTTSSAKLFYAFIEADSAPDERPIFVFTGGAPNSSAGDWIPGPATTGLFAVFGVSRATLNGDEPAEPLAQNDASWTDMGNLLFIDSRQAGFSYATLDYPADDGARGIEYASDNFNTFVDAADLVRALLLFLGDHPTLADNPIVLVGQGYAGVRSNLALAYLLYPERLFEAAGWDYSDDDLADRVLAHHTQNHPEAASISAALAATQFGWQVQLQPKIGGDQLGITEELWCQPGTPEYIAAEELAESCPPASRDPLHLGKPAGWALTLRQASEAALLSTEGFAAALFTEAAQVPGLRAAERGNAYRLGAMLAVEADFPRAPSEWTDALGEVPAHDRYYLDGVEQLIAGNGNFSDGNDLACVMLVEAAQHVATFVTNAQLDGRIRTQALAATIEDCAAWAATPLLDSVDVDVEPRNDVDRPGWLTLNYNDEAAIGASSRSIRWPSYETAGHLVNVSAPAELKQDVREFLEEAELPLGE